MVTIRDACNEFLASSRQINLTTFHRAREAMLCADVPANELIYFADPVEVEQLTNLPQFVNLGSINTALITDGMIGMLLGVKIVPVVFSDEDNTSTTIV